MDMHMRLMLLMWCEAQRASPDMGRIDEGMLGATAEEFAGALELMDMLGYAEGACVQRVCGERAVDTRGMRLTREGAAACRDQLAAWIERDGETRVTLMCALLEGEGHSDMARRLRARYARNG